MLINEIPGGDQFPVRLADLLAELPRAEQRRFRRELRYCAEVFGLADQLVRRPVPGLESVDQLTALLGFLIWRLRLVRRTVMRAQTGYYEGTLE